MLARLHALRHRRPLVTITTTASRSVPRKRYFSMSGSNGIGSVGQQRQHGIALDSSHTMTDAATGKLVIADPHQVLFADINPLPATDKPHISPPRITKIVLLGTGSAIPTARRRTSGYVVILSNGNQILVDCGEGTQMRIMESKSVNMSKIETILLTHLHGDHCYGVFGLLCTIAGTGRTQPLNIVAPLGIRKMLDAVFTCSGGFYTYPLAVHELQPGQHLPPTLLNSSDNVIIQAAPLLHRVPAFGYSIQEQRRVGNLDAAKAKALGVTGKLLGRLKEGLDVTLDNGTVVRGADVVSPPVDGKKVVILQDTANSDAAIGIAKNADVLIHEATYDSALTEKSILHGHSTSTMAGEYAAKVNAKLLVLTHFSSRYNRADTGTATEVPFPPATSLDAKPHHTEQASHIDAEDGSKPADALTIELLVREAAHAAKQIPVVAAEDFATFVFNKATGTYIVGEHDKSEKQQVVVDVDH